MLFDGPGTEREIAMHIRSVGTFALALGFALGVSTAAAHAADVRSDFNHMASFSDFHTYSWGQVKTNRPFFAQRIRREVDRDLQRRGWQLVPSGGDTTVFANGDVHNEQEMETYYNGYGGGWGGGWGWGGWGWGGGWGPGGFGNTVTQPINLRESHLVIDIFQSGNHKLLFRGVADNNLSNNATNNTHQLFKDIDKMFQHFPPKEKNG